MSTLKDFFSIGGILSETLKGYEPRPEQQAMAEAIYKALRNKNHLIVEAGTGVGKSLAYLIPVIEWVLDNDRVRDTLHVTVKRITDTDTELGHVIRTRRVAVSTYTKALQRQLIEKELPYLKDNIFKNLRFALCLGSENYLCLRRLDQTRTHGLFDMDEIHETDVLLKWARITDTGIRAEIDIRGSLWQKVCREGDLCYGKDCKFFNRCFYQKAKADERHAHVLVTNHHLFFAHVASGWQVLPHFDVAVFDEAHELEDVAADYLGVEISNYKLKHLLDSILSTHGRGLITRLKWLSQNDFSEASALLNTVRMKGGTFFQELVQKLNNSSTLRIRQKEFIEDSVTESLTRLFNQLGGIFKASGDEDEKKEIIALMNRCEEFLNSLKTILMQELEGYVYWAEKNGKMLRLAATPVEIAKLLKAGVFDNLSSAVLTSATLSINNNFDYIKERLGLHEAEELLLKSPFNYKEQSIVYIAEDLSEPKSKDFEERLIDRLRKILEMTKGRTLALFTSYNLLNKAYDAIDVAGVKIFKQGEADSYTLIKKFKQDNHSALFGTYTFWQGIDVPGDDLQCVVITKLPFAVPDAPIVEARMEALQREGKDPFSHYQIPQAAILLKQGFGRLIRTKTDKGIVAILDSRLRTKGYGRQFLNSLPECRMTTAMDDIKDFLADFENIPITIKRITV